MSVASSFFPSPATGRNVYPSLSLLPNTMPVSRFICTKCGRGYKTKHNLQRHRRNASHGPSTPTHRFLNFQNSVPAIGHPSPLQVEIVSDRLMYDCPHPECHRKGDRGFPRKDNMVQHQRLVHNAAIVKRERRKGSGIVKR